MNPIRVHLFGRFRIIASDKTVTRFETHKAQELFAYLMLHHQKPHHREKLSTLLWGDYSTRQAKRYLSKTLCQVQNSLPGTAQELLLTESEWIQVNPEMKLQIDALQLEQAYLLVNGIPGERLTGEQSEILQEATLLYQGHFLEGWLVNWCLLERERLLQLYLNILDKLVRYNEAHGRFEAGILYADQILQQDQAREHTHRCLMRLHYANRNRTLALRQYQRCVDTLSQELNVAPSRRTTALFQQIQRDQLLQSNPSPAPGPSPIIQSLEKIESSIQHFQAEIHTDMEKVRALLSNQT